MGLYTEVREMRQDVEELITQVAQLEVAQKDADNYWGAQVSELVSKTKRLDEFIDRLVDRVSELEARDHQQAVDAMDQRIDRLSDRLRKVEDCRPELLTDYAVALGERISHLEAWRLRLQAESAVQSAQATFTPQQVAELKSQLTDVDNYTGELGARVRRLETDREFPPINQPSSPPTEPTVESTVERPTRDEAVQALMAIEQYIDTIPAWMYANEPILQRIRSMVGKALYPTEE